MTESALLATSIATSRPRLGFLGVGWIGRHRLESIVRSGVAEVACVADALPACAREATDLVPDAPVASTLDELLAMDLDGIAIATPSAQHAGQAIRALEAGVAVFCQKPLGRTEVETRRVLDAARAADRLLGVDLSYRHTSAMRAIRRLVERGELGHVYAVDLVFHNAYGPDKPWFYDPVLSGGGCVIDLGTHLVDLALWSLGFPHVERVRGRLFAGGAPLSSVESRVEDHAVAEIELDGGVLVRLACSWGLHAGRDAVIEASFHGTDGGAAMRNIGGSFYDFMAERHRGTSRETMSVPPDEWGGRAAVAWARALADGSGYDPDAEHLATLAATLDRIYGR